MNLFLPKGSLVRLLSILLLGLLAACHAKPAIKALSLSEQLPTTPTPKLTTTPSPSAQPLRNNDISGELFDQQHRRTYYLYTPKSYQPNHPLPLVLAFHSYGKQGRDMAATTTLNRLAEQKGFIVVYPNAINKQWDVDGHAQTRVDDAAFVSALIAHITKIRAIDSHRIYATGSSDGGLLVQRLACQKPSQIAAFASVAASLPVQLQPSCQTKTPVSVLMINGTADPAIPWEGGKPPKVQIGPYLSIPSIPQVIDFWRQHNGCPSKAQVKQLSGSRVEVSRYPGCRAGSEVALVTLKGGGHIWPGGGSGKSEFLDAGQVVWDFFKGHALVQQTSHN